MKNRLCVGHHPSLHTCVSESMHSLIIIFLAVMPAYAIAVASTHSCPSSHAMLVHVFVWSTCRIQPDGNCTFILYMYIYKLHIPIYTHTHTWLRYFSSGWVPCSALLHGSESTGTGTAVGQARYFKLFMRSSHYHNCGNKTVYPHLVYGHIPGLWRG